MKITNISQQVRDPNRVNVHIDGKYRFSLDILQVTELGIKIGKEYDEEELTALENESQFGKAYVQALDYCLMRPHSAKEVRDYLYRKTRPKRTKTGELRPGLSPEVTARVFDRLVQRAYIDDEKFTRYWVENRSVDKGASRRKLVSELRSKGVEQSIIDAALKDSPRNDAEEIKKIVVKKRSRYPDDKKLIAYLARQGFSYDDITGAINDAD